jgi:hypothetical protein
MDLLNKYIEQCGGGGGGSAVSPTVEITPIANGHRVTITDINGNHTFDVLNGEKGEKGDTGKGFEISKTYPSIEAMNAGFATDGVPENSFVLIDTGNVEDEDNAKLFIKTKSGYSYLTDLSGAQGIKGEKGADGKTPYIQNGYWYIDGVNTNVKAQGVDGKDGVNGNDGENGLRGTGILNTTTGIASHNAVVGGVQAYYRISLSTLKTNSKVNEVLVGDTVRYSAFLYPIIYVDNEYAYMTTRVSIQGSNGTDGKDGTDGKTPEKGVDYWTETDKAEMVQEVLKNFVDVSEVGQ